MICRIYPHFAAGPKKVAQFIGRGLEFQDNPPGSYLQIHIAANINLQSNQALLANLQCVSYLYSHATDAFYILP